MSEWGGSDWSFGYEERHFDIIRDMVRERAGIELAKNKRGMVYNRVVKRIKALGFSNFDQYCDLIKSGEEDEMILFTNALTTNHTFFFRENSHFDYLANTVLPKIWKQKSNTRRVRIWCAASSTGEEPYSIATVVKESMPTNETWDIKILATDLDSQVLERARAGVYPENRIKEVSEERLARWFLRGSGENDGKVRVVDDLRSLLTFKQLNLMEDWPMKGPFDVIFCRNVVIYFSKETQKVLFGKMSDLLEPGSELFVGHSESLFGISDDFELVGHSIYRKLAGVPA